MDPVSLFLQLLLFWFIRTALFARLIYLAHPPLPQDMSSVAVSVAISIAIMPVQGLSAAWDSFQTLRNQKKA